MAVLLGHSITYRIAVGPQAGRKVFTLQTLPGCDEPFDDGVGKVAGFSLHAGVAARANERKKLERLCRYISRPAVSEKRLSLTPNGNIRYQLKTPYRDGTTHVIFEPLDLIARLAALVPKPRVNLTRFHGVFAPNSRHRALVTLAKRGRGNRNRVTDEPPTTAERRATMNWSDVEARIGSRAKAGQVAGNFNTLLMLRVKELDTAAMLTEQLPRVEVFTLMSVSGVDDSSDPGSGVDFKSRNEDPISVSEVPMLTAADMVMLPKGQAFALLEGGLLWKIRIPLPDDREDTAMPDDFEPIAEAMRRSYITNDHWYRVTDYWWPAVSEAAIRPSDAGEQA